MSTLATTFKKDEVLVLLGAGASVEAGIPHSAAMVREIEKALQADWSSHRELYNYVRSAIYYADGIRGTYGSDVAYNIERLVVSLDELSRREEHPLYPFVGAWNPRLAQVAGPNFENVEAFRYKILQKLRQDWIEIDNYDRASYYGGLVRFQKELQYPLHVFTLNYDLCVEKAYQAEYGEFPERGFGSDRLWSHAQLDDAPESSRLYLYKLHGSIDWIRDGNTRKLTFSDSTSKIKVEDGELIFGTSYKLQYVDPFLFLVYRLRSLSLEARLVIAVGYGFGDEHINGIIKQALRGDPAKRIVAVTWFGENLLDSDLKKAEEKFSRHAWQQLGLEGERQNQLAVVVSSAKRFLSEELTLASVTKFFPTEESLFDFSEPPAATQVP
jgi:hypothetical protein